MSVTKQATPSSKFYRLLDRIADSENTLRSAFEDAVNLAREEGFGDFEIALFMKSYLKDKVPARTLFGWVKPLEPKKDDSSSTSRQDTEIDKNKDTDETDHQSPPPNDEPQTPSGKNALDKFNSVYPSDSIDIKNHPVVQRLQHDLELERQEKTDWKTKAEQLGEVEGKRSFVSAKDEMNHISGQSTIIMLIMELQKRRNEWKKVKYLVEVVT